MRKILISIVLCLLLIGSTFFVIKGINKINISGFIGLNNKNQEIEQKNAELSNIISVKFNNAESKLKKAANVLVDNKTEYENQAMLSNSNKSSYISQLETYNIDFLWTKLGNYSRDEGVVIKIDLTSSGTSSNLYNLNFTVTGSYVGITNFIYDIENDSRLGFKIDEFKMSGESELTATYVCKEIPINVGTIEAKTTDDTTNAEDSSQEDTTNNSTTKSKPEESNEKKSTQNNSNTTSNTTNATNSKNTTSSNTTTDYLNNADY